MTDQYYFVSIYCVATEDLTILGLVMLTFCELILEHYYCHLWLYNIHINRIKVVIAIVCIFTIN